MQLQKPYRPRSLRVEMFAPVHSTEWRNFPWNDPAGALCHFRVISMRMEKAIFTQLTFAYESVHFTTGRIHRTNARMFAERNSRDDRWFQEAFRNVALFQRDPEYWAVPIEARACLAHFSCTAPIDRKPTADNAAVTRIRKKHPVCRGSLSSLTYPERNPKPDSTLGSFHQHLPRNLVFKSN